MYDYILILCKLDKIDYKNHSHYGGQEKFWMTLQVIEYFLTLVMVSEFEESYLNIYFYNVD